ncbi:MAG: alpha/beta fold hydrolase [Rhodospirillales bacterium]|nr:alpha/beta fold hydrolase [Rhodospirillales bacterium]
MKLSFVSDGDGPPVVILHGLFGSGRNWAGIAKQLAASHRVYLVDARNHGESPWADTMTYAEMAQDVADFIAAENLDRPVVIGHSMGGKIAMTLALSHGDRLGGLVVMDIAPVAYGVRFDNFVGAMQGLDLSAVARRADADGLLAAHVPEPGIRAFLLHNLVAQDGGYRWRINLDAIAANNQALAGFGAGGAFDGPTLVLCGAESDYVLPEHEVEIRRLFPQASIDRIAGAGHWLHADQPGQLMDRLEGFLEAL